MRDGSPDGAESPESSGGVGDPAATTMACSACGAEVAGLTALPFRCPAARAGDDVDHVLAKRLAPDRVTFARAEDEHPFLRYRELLHTYQAARRGGLSDEDWAALVTSLDAAVAAVDGRGFRVTPCARDEALGAWVKDETGSVAGSHKGRHLFGIALWLRVLEALELPGGAGPLAVASCGNAALAAAVVARAAGRELEVFVPASADAAVVARLAALGARLTRCPRAPREHGERGDPCYARLLAALDAGALPFTVQGNLNGLAIEGGSTLGYELIEELVRHDVELDRLFVQVGGGALATALVQAFRDARAVGFWRHEPPRLFAVQTEAAHPLQRAHARIVARGGDWRRALDEAAQRRSAYMQPWGEEPHSVATGILDDETYDWRAVVAGLLATGGGPVVVSEDRLLEARSLARAYGASATGSAGLAGLLELRARGEIEPTEQVAVLLTGVQR